MTDQLETIVSTPGRLEAELKCADEDLRAFVTVTSFVKHELLGGEKRFAYFPDSIMLYKVARYQVESSILAHGTDISERELLDYQSIVLPDKEHLVVILNMWLPSLDVLTEPKFCDAPY